MKAKDIYSNIISTIMNLEILKFNNAVLNN
jgi:hypothetical protein